MPVLRARPSLLFAFLAAPLLTLGLFTACITSDEKDSGGKNTGAALPDTVATDVSWSSDATDYQGQTDRKIAYECPANGFISSVWGTDVYTDDSSVCTAAVHAGKITLAAGGTVVIRIRPGDSAYVATTRNGVTSSSWGAWSGSFIFP